MTTRELARRTAGRAILLRDRHGAYHTRCPEHDTQEAWPSERVARIACQPAHVADWCPWHGDGEPEPPEAA